MFKKLWNAAFKRGDSNQATWAAESDVAASALPLFDAPQGESEKSAQLHAILELTGGVIYDAKFDAAMPPKP